MFLDTSVIVELLTSPKESERSGSLLRTMKDEPLSISEIQLGELSDWCLRNDIEPIGLIQKLTDIVSVFPLSERIVLQGSALKHTRPTGGFTKFRLIDGIIWASALELKETLLTLDQDFSGLENVIVLDS